VEDQPQGSRTSCPSRSSAVRVLFVVVSARITGLWVVRQSISGITIAVVMLTCLLFVLVGWVGGTTRSSRQHRRGRLRGRLQRWQTAQDLKTGTRRGVAAAAATGLLIAW